VSIALGQSEFTNCNSTVVSVARCQDVGRIVHVAQSERGDGISVWFTIYGFGFLDL
jgi:hypothetical protein